MKGKYSMNRTNRLLPSALFLVLSIPAKAASPVITPALMEKAKASYTANCTLCHGDKGDGNGLAGAGMNPKPRNFAVDKFKAGEKPENVFKTISDGLPNTAMTGYAFLAEDERWALASYILSFRKPKK